MALNSEQFNGFVDGIIKLSKAIFRTPYGILVIILCVVIFYQYQQNKKLSDELRETQIDFTNTLKQLNEGLTRISDSTKIIKK